MEATQAPLPGPEIILIGFITATLVIAQATWSLVEQFDAMAHEGIHAVVGSLSGRRVNWINLDEKAGGETDFVPKSGP